MPRPVALGTFAGHLAACLEAGLTFAWDHRRLGIDLDLERKVHGPERWRARVAKTTAHLFICPFLLLLFWPVLVLFAIGAAAGELGVKWTSVQCWW